MEHFSKIDNRFYSLANFAKSSIVDVSHVNMSPRNELNPLVAGVY